MKAAVSLTPQCGHFGAIISLKCSGLVGSPDSDVAYSMKGLRCAAHVSKNKLRLAAVAQAL
eukprot:1282584-Pleurochrysis_carterae.AAC.1